MEIIKLELKDVEKAADIFVKAFQDDPIFHYVFGSKEKYFKKAPWLFKTWVNWAVMFGEAWITDDGNSVVIMRSLEHSEMSLWSMIRAGMLPTPIKLGWKTFLRFYINMVMLLEKKNQEIMGPEHHWYGWMIGVKPEFKGMGRILLNHCFKLADERKLPIYLETSTRKNVAMYNHLDFKLLEEVYVPKGDFNLFFLVREPKTSEQ